MTINGDLLGGNTLKSAILILVLISMIVVIPLWSTNIPPSLDYHNHLARQHILVNLQDSEILQTFYQEKWYAAPYLAMDGIVQLLSNYFTVETAGKIFLSLYL